MNFNPQSLQQLPFLEKKSFIHSHLSCSFSSDFRKFWGFLWLEVSCPKPQLVTWNLQIANLSQPRIHEIDAAKCEYKMTLTVFLLDLSDWKNCIIQAGTIFLRQKMSLESWWFDTSSEGPHHSTAHKLFEPGPGSTSPSLGLCATLVGSLPI